MATSSPSSRRVTKTPPPEPELRKLVAEKQQLQQQRRELSAEIGRAKQAGQDPSQLIEQNRELSRRIEQIEARLAEENSDQTASAEGTLVTDVLTTTDAFENLRGEWGRLMSEANVYSPFMMWEWLYPWWTTYGGNKRLRLIAVRDERNSLVGLAPMMIGFTENGRCDPRVLAVVGSGEEGPRGQYFSFIVAPQREKDILSAIVGRVRELRSEWQVMKLWRLRQDDVYREFLDLLTCYDDLAAIVAQKESTIHGPLPATMSEFIDSVPVQRRRRYLRSQENKLRDKYAGVCYEVCKSVEELPHFISTIHELNIRRHQAKDETSSWLDREKRECFGHAAQLLFAAGCLRAELLHIDNQPAAGLASLIRNGTCFVFEPGFVPEFAQDRVGHVLFGLCIEDCIEAGLTHFDWLSAQDYHYEYFSDEQIVLELTVFHNASPSLRYIGSHLWSRGVKARIKKMVRWPQIKRLLHRAR